MTLESLLRIVQAGSPRSPPPYLPYRSSAPSLFIRWTGTMTKYFSSVFFTSASAWNLSNAAEMGSPPRNTRKTCLSAFLAASSPFFMRSSAFGSSATAGTAAATSTSAHMRYFTVGLLKTGDSVSTERRPFCYRAAPRPATIDGGRIHCLSRTPWSSFEIIMRLSLLLFALAASTCSAETPNYRVLGQDKGHVAIVNAKGEVEWETP